MLAPRADRVHPQARDLQRPQPEGTHHRAGADPVYGDEGFTPKKYTRSIKYATFIHIVFETIPLFPGEQEDQQNGQDVHPRARNPRKQVARQRGEEPARQRDDQEEEEAVEKGQCGKGMGVDGGGLTHRGGLLPRRRG